MADAAVKALTHWRQRGRDLRHEHTREVQTREVRAEFPPNAQAALLKVAMELDAANERIRRLEAVLARLAIEARQEA